MLALFRRVITIYVLLHVLATSVLADTDSQTFVRFVPDEVLPKNVLDTFLENRDIGKYRVVVVDADAIRQVLRDAFSPSDGTESPTISLPLVDGALITIELQRGGESHSGWQAGLASFGGKVAGNKFSAVTCVISPDGSVNLTISTAGRRYKLEQSTLLPYHIYWSNGKGPGRRID